MLQWHMSGATQFCNSYNDISGATHFSSCYTTTTSGAIQFCNYYSATWVARHTSVTATTRNKCATHIGHSKFRIPHLFCLSVKNLSKSYIWDGYWIRRVSLTKEWDKWHRDYRNSITSSYFIMQPNSFTFRVEIIVKHFSINLCIQDT
jgi:hypothetical protein